MKLRAEKDYFENKYLRKVKLKLIRSENYLEFNFN